jgi:nucleoid-associated protein YgaU
MLLKGSRYENVRAFEPGEDGSRFPGVRPRAIGTTTGVVEHVVKSGDRLDLLARHYYNDDRLWWRIADANPEFIHADMMLAEVQVGQIILIPRARE